VNLCSHQFFILYVTTFHQWNQKKIFKSTNHQILYWKVSTTEQKVNKEREDKLHSQEVPILASNNGWSSRYHYAWDHEDSWYQSKTNYLQHTNQFQSYQQQTMTNHHVNSNLKTKQWCNLHTYQGLATSNEETSSKVNTLFNWSTQQFKKWRLTGIRYLDLENMQRDKLTADPKYFTTCQDSILIVHFDASFNQHQHGNNLSALNAHMTIWTIVRYKS